MTDFVPISKFYVEFLNFYQKDFLFRFQHGIKKYAI